MSKKDWDLFLSLDQWFTYDENNYCVLRPDTPKEVKESLEMLEKKYPDMFD